MYNFMNSILQAILLQSVLSIKITFTIWSIHRIMQLKRGNMCDTFQVNNKITVLAISPYSKSCENL